MNILGVVCVINGLIGAIFISAALGSADWYNVGGGSIGLFRACAGGICASFEPPGNASKVAAAFNFLALFSFLVVVGAAVFGILKSKNKSFQVAGLFAVLSAIFIIIANATYVGLSADGISAVGASYGWGFILPWVAIVFSIVATVTAFMASK